MTEKSIFWKDGYKPETESDEETTNNSSHQKGKINMDDAIKPEIPQHNSFIYRNQMRANITKPNWLIKGILKRGTSNLLFGESGAGKSLYALDWAFCLANGINWHEHKVKEKGVVLDGRDIGTTVFPEAELKLFMTADEKIRIQRRLDEYTSKGEYITEDEVRKNISKRDYEDTHRKESPLLKANDAIILDNSDLDKQQQLDYVMRLINDLQLIK